MKSTVLSLFSEVSIDFLFIKQSFWVILRARQWMNYTKINMLGHSILLQRSCNLTCVSKNSSLWLVFYFPFTAITKGIVRDNLVISSTERRSHQCSAAAAAAAKSLQSCPTLCDPMDCSLPGSSIHGIFQATVLEWGAIAFFLRVLGFPNQGPHFGITVLAHLSI